MMSMVGRVIEERRWLRWPRRSWAVERAAARADEARQSPAAVDYVTLADGSVVAVARANLAAAKALIAARNVASRRVAAGLPRAAVSSQHGGALPTPEQLLRRWAAEGFDA